MIDQAEVERRMREHLARATLDFKMRGVPMLIVEDAVSVAVEMLEEQTIETPGVPRAENANARYWYSRWREEESRAKTNENYRRLYEAEREHTEKSLADQTISAREWEARARATAEAHGAACRRVLELEESIAEMRERCK